MLVFEADALLFVVGNSRHLWSTFLDHCIDNHQQSEMNHPLDEYVEKSIHTALEKMAILNK